jgi:hypothetical protein
LSLLLSELAEVAVGMRQAWSILEVFFDSQ